MNTSLGIAVMVVVFTSATAVQMKVAITSPADGSTVVERPTVEGTVSDAKVTIWVIVHPLEVSDYWVQPRVTVRESGSWKVQIFIGRPGRVDIGKLFEIRAVVNPKVTLREGLVLDRWPEAAAISDVVEVTRK